MHFTDIHGPDAIHPGKSSPPLFADSAVLSFFSVYTFAGFSQMPIAHAKCDKYRQKVNGLLDYSKPIAIMQMQLLPFFWWIRPQPLEPHKKMPLKKYSPRASNH